MRWIVSLRAAEDGTPVLVTDDPDVVRAVVAAITEKIDVEATVKQKPLTIDAERLR